MLPTANQIKTATAFFNNELSGKEIYLKYPDRLMAIYEIKTDDCCFTIISRSKNQPQKLIVPKKLDSIFNFEGNTVYIDLFKRKWQFVISKAEWDFKDYNKPKDEDIAPSGIDIRKTELEEKYGLSVTKMNSNSYRLTNGKKSLDLFKQKYFKVDTKERGWIRNENKLINKYFNLITSIKGNETIDQ